MKLVSRATVPLLIASTIVALVPAASASDWSRWRGPNQDGTVAGGVFGDEAFGLEVAWSRPLGIAYSGIASSGGRAVTMYADGETDWLVAFETGSGTELWRYRIDSMFPSIGGSEGGPVSMPVIDDGVVFGLGAKGHLFAVDFASGRELWSLRIDEALGARQPHFGFTTAPLVVDDLVFVQAGGDEGRSLVAFDRASGKVRWSIGEDTVAYQSPLYLTLAGKPQIVAVTNRTVSGLVPATGEVLWRKEHGLVDGDDGSATPVLLGDNRFLLTGNQGSKAFRVTAADGGFEVEELWLSTNLKQSLATPVLLDGKLYGFDGNFLTCIDPATGDKVWKSRPPGGRGLIAVDGHLVIFANDGNLVVAEASPEGYAEKARLEVMESGSYTYPSFADGLILVRNTRELAAVRVGAKPEADETAAGDDPPRNDFDRFVRRVERSADRELLVDRFMADQAGFPVIEDDRWVHFLYRGDADDVAISGTMTEYQIEEPLERIEGTDLFHRSYEIESGARWEYRLNVDFDNLQPDPLNPRRVRGSQGDLSEVATSGWNEPTHLEPYDGPRPGRIETFTFASEILEDERDVDVYLPAGYDEGRARHRLLVVLNGKDWLDKAYLPNSLDHLVGERIEPVIVAFVDSPRSTARAQLGGPKSADFTRMLTDELVPRLDRDYRTETAAGSRAILGSTSGALIAAWAAISKPDVFGTCGALSVYLPDPGGARLVEAIADADGAGGPMFWVVWNRYELRRAEWSVDFGQDSKRLVEALTERGFDVTSREAIDAYGWGGWRVRAGEFLESTFAK